MGYQLYGTVDDVTETTTYRLGGNVVVLRLASMDTIGRPHRTLRAALKAAEAFRLALLSAQPVLRPSDVMVLHHNPPQTVARDASDYVASKPVYRPISIVVLGCRPGEDIGWGKIGEVLQY